MIAFLYIAMFALAYAAAAIVVCATLFVIHPVLAALFIGWLWGRMLFGRS